MTNSPPNIGAHREALVVEFRGKLPMFWEVCTSDSETVFRGPLSIKDADGAELEAFTIEVAVPRSYPNAIPMVTETTGRIPRTLDRHVSSSEGLCCIELPFEFHRRHPQLSVTAYVLGPVSSYFLAQLHFEQFGSWPAGERGHGFQGVREAIVELFGIDDVDLLLGLVSMVLRWRQTKHDACACGSGSRLFACHGKRIRAEVREWPQPALSCLVLMLLEEQKRRRACSPAVEG